MTEDPAAQVEGLSVDLQRHGHQRDLDHPSRHVALHDHMQPRHRGAKLEGAVASLRSSHRFDSGLARHAVKTGISVQLSRKS